MVKYQHTRNTANRLIRVIYYSAYGIVFFIGILQFASGVSDAATNSSDESTCNAVESSCYLSTDASVTTMDGENKNEGISYSCSSNLSEDEIDFMYSFDDCGLYLAPSTIANAGLGIFAGKEYHADDILSTDIVVPVVDLVYNHGERYFLFDEYTWNGEAINMDHEGHEDVYAVSPGFGAAVNCFQDLVNVEESNPYNDLLWLPPNYSSTLHRFKDPGVGAFSTYHHRNAIAKKHIRQGSEMFVNYGKQWFETRKKDIGPVPLRGDLKSATKLFKKFIKVKDQVLSSLSSSTIGPTSSASATDNIKFNNSNTNITSATISQTDIIFEDIWNMFIKNSSWKDQSRIIGAFDHEDTEEELKYLEQQSKPSLHSLRVEQSTRSMEWLDKNGICSDNLKYDVSTMKQAGRGAFSTRLIKKGKIVASLPLVHVLQDILDMYQYEEISPEKGKRAKSLNGIHSNITYFGKQLLINYCYGNKKSDLLLCPYSPVVYYVNHGNETIANVKLQWITDEKRSNHNSKYFDMDIHQLENLKSSVLNLEFIALRDIQPNEEIFLDYGKEWENAWNEHIQKWKPPPSSENYTSAAILNHLHQLEERAPSTRIANNKTGATQKTIHSTSESYNISNGSLLRLRTKSEQKDNPYPSNVDLKCDFDFFKNAKVKRLSDKITKVYVKPIVERVWEGCDIVEYKKVDDERQFVYTIYATEEDKNKKNENDDNDDDDEQSKVTTETVRSKKTYRVLNDVPREAFRFFDRPYTSDMFLENAFRHPIMIPDEIFPKKWMNKIK